MGKEYEIHALHLHFGAPALKGVDESRPAGTLRMDEAAFRVFYEQTSVSLLRYLQVMTRTKDIAEDLLQESYCRFLAASLPPMDEAQARNYLFRIATNLLRDCRRSAKREYLDADGMDLPSSAPNIERKLGVQQAFHRLKPRERQLLWLAYVEGSNHREIAGCTGLRPGSIRLLLFRARRRLAELLGENSSSALGPEVHPREVHNQ